MPNRYQRPCSSQILSHLRAIRPARNARNAPSTPGIIAAVSRAVVETCSALTRRSTSRAITGGVRTTAKAKLKFSAFDREIRERSAVDMVR